MSGAATIPGYTIERELGRGGTGTVYQAVDIQAARNVALKVIPLDVDITKRQRFEVEAKVGAMLDHDDIIDVYDAGVVDGLGYIAMELLDGFELNVAMKDEAFGADDRVRVLIRVASALHYAHQRDIIHRDVKPSNIFLTRDGQVKLLDFGIARLKANKITRTGFVVGTPQFMAPEQISALPVDVRTDVFSLGVVAYELFAGQLPWSGDNPMQIMIAVCAKPPVPLTSVFDGTRFGLNTTRVEHIAKIVHHAIQQKPADRYVSTEAMLAALSDFLEGRDDEPAVRSINWAAEHAAMVAPPPIVDTRTREIGAAPDDGDAGRRSVKVWLALLAAFAIGGGVTLWVLGGL